MASGALVHTPCNQCFIRKHRLRSKSCPIPAKAAVLGQEFGWDVGRRLFKLPLERTRRVGCEGRELLRDIVLANAGGELIGAGRPGLIVGSRGLVWEQAKPGCFEDYKVESADDVTTCEGVGKGGLDRRTGEWRVQGPRRLRTSVAAAPMTMNVADSWYCVPLGQVHGVSETAEHAGTAETSARGASIANWHSRKRRCIVPLNG